MPSCASEMTSSTPFSPRRTSLRRNSVQKVSASEAPMSMPEHLAPAVRGDADGDDHRHRDDPPVLAHLQVGGIDPEVGIVALDRPVQERLHPFVDLGAEPADLALRDAAMPSALHQVVDRAGRDALNVGLLDHRGQRLLRHPPRVEEAREVAAPCGASGCAARRCRRGSPSPGRGSRCAAPAARGSSRPRRRR